MVSKVYNGFVVVVEAVQQTPYVSTRNPLVIIGAYSNREWVTSLYSTVQFHTDEDAEDTTSDLIGLFATIAKKIVLPKKVAAHAKFELNGSNAVTKR